MLRQAARAILCGVVFLSHLASGAIPTPRKKPNLALTTFYQTPMPLPAGKPGELIRSQRFDDYDLPYDIRTLRILYHSRSANGKDTAASGVVLLPSGKPPAHGWPVIAFAHRFTGVGRECAPSLMRNLHSGPFLAMYVELGYAVIAPDYTGLGTDFPNAYLDIESNASDVINSVTAAHEALPQLSRDWIALGDAEGSLAVIAVAELGNDHHVLGTIAVGGIGDAEELLERSAEETPSPTGGLLAYGIKSVFPAFEPGAILAAESRRAYSQLSTACIPEAVALKRNWQKDPSVVSFFARNRLADKPASAPLLLIDSDRDTTTTPVIARRLVAKLCQKKDRVQFSQYPNLESGQLLSGSVREQMAWIQDRFSGRSAPSTCP